MKNIKNDLSSCVLIGDKGYLSADYQIDLFTSSQIKLEVPMRVNQHDYQKQPYLFRKTRKPIETLFSQLCDQFMIRRNYAKSFDGYKNRILSKITSLTVIQMINKLLNRNINSINLLSFKCTTSQYKIFCSSNTLPIIISLYFKEYFLFFIKSNYLCLVMVLFFFFRKNKLKGNSV